MERELYTFATEMLPLSDTPELPENQRQGVHFTVQANLLESIIETIDRWFEGFDTVVLVAQGTTRNELGYVIMEWDACEIDPEFKEVLENDEHIEDYTFYLRDKEL